MKTYIRLMNALKLLVVICLLPTMACEDYLDRYSKNSPTDVTFLNTEEELEMALVGCKSSLWTQSGDELPFVLFTDCNSDIAASRDQTPYQLWGSAGAGYPIKIWAGNYSGVARCNYLLTNMGRAESVTQKEVYNRIKAEARFLRAYYYYQLTELFGDVPLITTPQTLQGSQVARDPKATVVDFILNELEDAAKDLPVENKPNTAGICKAAAWGLKAKVALYNAKWDVAIESAKNVMQYEGSQVVIHPQYEELFLRKGMTSKEIIFAIQYAYTNQWAPHLLSSRNAKGLASRIPTQALVDSYECTDGLTIDKSPLYDPNHPYDHRDPRLGYTVACPGSVFWGYQFETHKDSVKCWNYNVNPAVRIDNQDAIATWASFSGYAWKKYSDPTENNPNNKSEINLIVLRYADILLTYAEAKIEKGELDASVYEAINKVRQRPSVKMPVIREGKTQAELRNIVRKERKYELALEGVRYYDIVRWGIADKVMSGPCYGRIPRGYLSSAPAIDEMGTPDYSKVANSKEMRVIQDRFFNPKAHYLWPIPDKDMAVNKKLVQNPGY